MAAPAAPAIPNVIRTSPALPGQPTFHLCQVDILDMPTEAIVLQLDADRINDLLAVNPWAWWARIGARAQAQLNAIVGPRPNGGSTAFVGHGGTLGAQPAAGFPRMVFATRVDDVPALLPPPPPAPPAVGRDNPDYHLRRAVARVLSRAFNIRTGLDPVDANVPVVDQWKLTPPTTIAFPLIGCRSGFGYDNSAENIVSSIVGWYRNPNLAAVFGTPAQRLAAIPHIYLIIPTSTRANRRLKQAKIRAAWEKAWDRYIAPPPVPARLPRGMAAQVNGHRNEQRVNPVLAGPSLDPADNDGRLIVPNNFANNVGAIAAEFPLNRTPWVQEQVTAAWLNRNYKVLRRGRLVRNAES